MEDIKVVQHENGQYNVTKGNLLLIHTAVGNIKINECWIKGEDYDECLGSYDPQFAPLFIALHNYKCGF